MKRLTALLISLALMALTALPAFAQGGNDIIEIDLDEQNNSGISGTATLEGYGDSYTEVTLLLEGVGPDGEYPAHIHAGQCPEPGAITHQLEPVVPNSGGEPGFEGGYSFTVVDVPLDEILAQQSAINVHLYSDPSVYVACGTLPMAGGEDKDTGAGDDQQNEGKTPDNQQGGGKEMVTKTFELTLNGDVPADQGFYVGFKTTGHEGPSVIRVFCGQLGSLGEEEDCEGNGTTYEVEYQFEPGTVVEFAFFRMSESGGVDNERFHEGTETITADTTNTAWYTFGAGAGDDQQDDDKDTGAGDDEQLPDNQQAGDNGTGAGDEQEMPDNQQDDVQDDQQGEMPGEMPDTGMGGLAPGAAIPVGNAVAGLAMLVGAGCAVLRNR